MTISPQTNNLSPEIDTPFATRTPHIIGRQDCVDAIIEAITDVSGGSHVIYFCGQGGIGKTRILEEVKVIQQKLKIAPFRWSGIIDLYHADFHSPSGLRRGIADSLDPENEFFHEYRKLRSEFQNKQEAGIVGPELNRLRQQLDIQFQTAYEILASKHRLVLCFDTLELIQYESDAVQKICQVQDVDTEIKNWFLEQISRFPNTVTLFAGRPRPKVQDDFEQGFTQQGLDFKLFNLEALTQEETLSYLQAMSQQRSELIEILTPEVQTRLFHITQGRPIYLSLLIDLLLHGQTPLGQIFPASNGSTQKMDIALVGQQLVKHLLDMAAPYGQMVYFLMHARRGLDVNLLGHLVGNLWSPAEIEANLASMHQFAFIKTRPGTQQLFLHDEVYDLFDRYFQADREYRRELRSIAQYYRQRREAATSMQEREDMTVTLLYYELLFDAHTGYQNYARWDEEAIKGHESGYDMRLREEVLRFLERYANPASDLYDQNLTERIDQAAIDRDCAVRWVNRYLLTRRDRNKALEIAENLYTSRHPTFNWDTIDDPIYKAGLLTAWGEALLYPGASEARVKLEQAIQLLENDRDWDKDQRWWRARILGRANNNLGYFYRGQGRYSLALQAYRRALPHFTKANIPEERALTLNNLAYLLALLGRGPQARRHATQALQIRKQLGRQYPIALSRATLGRVYVLESQPATGERKYREALRICTKLQETRGIGMVSNGLGFALRKRGDQWKQGICSQNEAGQYFQEAVSYFERAAQIFSQEETYEPIRLWEAYNEWGSLYCDWGWLTRHLPTADRPTREQAAFKQYSESIKYQKKALEIAREHNLEFQIADSYDDLAQVYGDRSFLLLQMDKAEQARQSRQEAINYLDRVEKMVPEAFHLVPEIGFREDPEPAYLQHLGKAHLWRGIWAFRDLETGVVPDQERPDVLRQATRYLILALAYFHRSWPASFAVQRTLDYFSDFLQVVEIPAAQAREQVKTIAQEYRVSSEVLEELIDNVLGL